MSEGAKRLAEQGLQIHLPRVDDVVNAARVPEGRRRRIALMRCRGPQRMPARLLSEEAVPEIASEQAEFPELVGDVFADVGDDAVRSDDDFFARVGRLDVFA